MTIQECITFLEHPDKPITNPKHKAVIAYYIEFLKQVSRSRA